MSAMGRKQTLADGWSERDDEMVDKSADPPEERNGCLVCGGTGLIIQVEDGVPMAVPCICTREGSGGSLWPPNDR